MTVSKTKNHRSEFGSSGSSPGSSPTPAPFRSRHALSVPEAERFLGVTPWFLEQAVREGQIPFRQLGDRRVFDADDLEVWLAAQPKVRGDGIEVGNKVVKGKVYGNKLRTVAA